MERMQDRDLRWMKDRRPDDWITTVRANSAYGQRLGEMIQQRRPPRLWFRNGPLPVP